MHHSVLENTRTSVNSTLNFNQTLLAVKHKNGFEKTGQHFDNEDSCT